MKYALAVFLTLAAADAAAASCTTMHVPPRNFFARATDIAVARHQDGFTFLVTQVYRGSSVAGAELVLPDEAGKWYCRPKLIPGNDYFVVKSCALENGARACRYNWAPAPADDYDRYLRQGHAETHEGVIAALMDWARGRKTNAELAAWIDAADVAPRSEIDDDFTARLLDRAGETLFELRQMQQCAPAAVRFVRETRLPTLIPLLESFPEGPADAFDDRVEALGDEEAWTRYDFEQQLLHDLLHVYRGDEVREIDPDDCLEPETLR